MDIDNFLDKYNNTRNNYREDKIQKSLFHKDIFSKGLFNEVIDIINDAKDLDENFEFLICDDVIGYNEEQLKRVEDLYNFIRSNNLNCYFRQARGNFTLEEVINARKQVLELADKIKKQNLSPMEQLLSVYIEITKKPYNNLGARHINSSVYGVLNSDKILCVGYSELFEAIMRQINTKDINIYQNSVEFEENKRHSNLLVHIIDKKYNINGYYILDPTYDNREDRKEAIRLTFFLIPLKDYKTIKRETHLDTDTERYYTSRDNGYNTEDLELHRKYETREGNISILANKGYVGISTIMEILKDKIIKNTTIDLLEENLKDEKDILEVYKKIKLLKQNEIEVDDVDKIKDDVINAMDYLSAPIPLKFIKNAVKTYLKTIHKDLSDEAIVLLTNSVMELNIYNAIYCYEEDATNCFAVETYKNGKEL